MIPELTEKELQVLCVIKSIETLKRAGFVAGDGPVLNEIGGQALDLKTVRVSHDEARLILEACYQSENVDPALVKLVCAEIDGRLKIG